MNLSAIIGTAFGLAFVYLLLSLVCSTIQEWIASLLHRRAANLRKGIQALLGDKTAVDKLFGDPMLQSMMARSVFREKIKEKSLAYLPSDRFSDALFNQFIPAALTPATDIETAITNANLPTALNDPLVTLARRAAGDRDRFIANVQKWFDDTMDRVSGWYKREAQIIIIGIAVVVTVAVNADSLKIATKLYNDPVVRERISVMADQWLADHPSLPTPGQNSDELRKQFDSYMSQLDETKLPIWWEQAPTLEAAGHALPGWILTVIALSLGAPFWFDVLMKLANLRNNGPKPKKQTEV